MSSSLGSIYPKASFFSDMRQVIRIEKTQLKDGFIGQLLNV